MIDDILGGITSTIDSVTGLIDEATTTDEERLRIKKQMQELRMQVREGMLRIKEKQIDAKQGIISSAKDTPFWRNWRGLVMLGIFLLAALHSLVPGVAYFSSETLAQILKWGLGGYVGGEVIETGIKEREQRKAKEAESKALRDRAVLQWEAPTPDMNMSDSAAERPAQGGEGKSVPTYPPEQF
jgi:hypothetical protein